MHSKIIDTVIPLNLSLDNIGYKTNQGIIYLGKNKKSEFLYTMPTDIEGFIQVSKAVEWVENTNNICRYGYNDWDLPTGHMDDTNELQLILNSHQKLNDVFHFNSLFYGSKTFHSKNRYCEIMLQSGNVHSFDERNSSCFRAIRREKDLII